MKKTKFKYIIIIFSIFLISICLPTKVNSANTEILESQIESLNISTFLNESNKYTIDLFGDQDIQNLFSQALSGSVDNDGIFKSILNLLGSEVLSSIRVLGSILIIIVIHSILKSISDNLENSNVSQIIYYVQYILIVSLIMTSFADIISMFNETIQNLVGFTNSLVPLLITLMMVTGNLVSASFVQPVLLFIITFIGNVISTFILPLLFVGTALGIVSNISDKVQIDRLSKYFKSGIVWALGLLLTIFISVLSIEGTLTSSIDGVTAKTAKAAVSGLIPVVGKILGDAVDTVLGCANILKNAVGMIGVLVVIGICILPVLKIAVLTVVYYIAGALAEPIADEKIVKLLDQMGGTFKILLGIICSVSVMLIIGVTIVINITNSGLMYR